MAEHSQEFDPLHEAAEHLEDSRGWRVSRRGLQDSEITVRFDAGGVAWWWGIYVGRVLVWGYSHSDPPMDADAKEILRGLVSYGTTLVASDSFEEFRKAYTWLVDG